MPQIDLEVCNTLLCGKREREREREMVRCQHDFPSQDYIYDAFNAMAPLPSPNDQFNLLHVPPCHMPHAPAPRPSPTDRMSWPVSCVPDGLLVLAFPLRNSH